LNLNEKSEQRRVNTMTAIEVIVALIVGVVGAAAGYFVGYNNRKKTAEAQIGSAEAEATRLVNEAIKTADQKRKEAVLEAKDEAFKLKAEVDAQKAEADKEIKQRRAEISRQENRIDQKENALDRKTEALERKEEDLKKRTAEADARLAEIDALRAKEMERLETLAGLSQEDAREVLLHKVDEELTLEKGRAHCRLRDRPEGELRQHRPQPDRSGREPLRRRPLQRDHRERGAAAQ